MTLAGWSFPTAQHRGDPFDAPNAAAALARPDRGALLVVLHADLDAGASLYAPLPRARLQGCGADAAFVGHVHAPDALDVRPFGYLGSLCGLDAGEPGARGPWLVRVGGGVRAEHVALAPIVYGRIDVDVGTMGDGTIRDGAIDDDAVAAAISAAVARWPVAGPARLAVVRVRLVGRGDASAALAALSRGLPMVVSGESGGPPRLITHITTATLPAVDLPRLALGHTPSAHVAQLALALRTAQASAAASAGTSDAASGVDGEPAVETDPTLQALRKDAAAMVASSPFAATKTLGKSVGAPNVDALLQDAVAKALHALLATRNEAG